MKSISGNRVVPCKRTDRQDEANSCFSQFCEIALKKSYQHFRKFLAFLNCVDKGWSSSLDFFGKGTDVNKTSMGEHHASGVKKFRSQ